LLSRSWRWCLPKNIERKATGNHLSIFPVTDDGSIGRHKKHGAIGGLDLPEGRELKEKEVGLITVSTDIAVSMLYTCKAMKR